MSNNSAAEEAVAKPTSTFISLDIDPDGDVYLCSDEFKLLVSSKVLSVASPVFKKLFGPNFFEASQVSETKPGSVTLAADDAAAMVALCQILHHQSRKVTARPSFVFLGKAAIVADKYDCFPAMTQWGGNYCYHMLQIHPDGIDAGRLLLPTVLFDDPVGFRAVTKSMVYSLQRTEYDRLHPIWTEEFGPHTGDHLPSNLLRTLSERQNDVKVLLQASIESIFNVQFGKLLKATGPNRAASADDQYSHDPYYFSECDSTKIALFYRTLHSHKLWPLTAAIRTRTLKELATALESCVFPKPKMEPSRCESCNLDAGARVRASIITAQKAFGGLCLDCVKYGKPEESRRECRIPHTGYLNIN